MATLIDARDVGATNLGESVAVLRLPPTRLVLSTTKRLTFLALTISLLALIGLVAPARAAAAPTDCQTTVTAEQAAQIVALSRPQRVPSDPTRLLAHFEDRVAAHHQIVTLLVEAGDRRGLFFLGLDVAERQAVQPRQRAGVQPDPAWARRLSTDLLDRALDALHREFTHSPQPYHWRRYFDAAADCSQRGANVAMVGYNAHLTVDLAESVAAAHTRVWHYPGYYDLVASIARQGSEMARATAAAYGPQADFGPLWRFYCFGEFLDALTLGMGSPLLLQFVDQGYSTTALNNGRAIENPLLTAATRHLVWQQWAAVSQGLRNLALVGAP